MPQHFCYLPYLRGMTRQQLVSQIRDKKSCLCIGLDSDISKIPRHLLSFSDPVFEFNKRIIDATSELCVAYKINTAFYESRGAKGWESMENTVQYIPSSHFKIADAKRGDIGNTASQYAKAFFETMAFDAITVAPYMGEDSIKPFLEYRNKWTIVLGLTSNPGARDFELQEINGGKLYELVLKRVASWGSAENLMFVIGATRPQEFERVRKTLPEHFFLVPGIGTQGGDLKDVLEKAMNSDCGILLNISRAIIFAGQGRDFDLQARAIATSYQNKMQNYLL